MAAAGIVATHEINIFLTILKSTASKPRANPTPQTAPITACVVETGIPIFEANKTLVAAEKSMENPRELVSSVILLPTVPITL